jgi:hypothetical protein
MHAKIAEMDATVFGRTKKVHPAVKAIVASYNRKLATWVETQPVDGVECKTGQMDGLCQRYTSDWKFLFLAFHPRDDETTQDIVQHFDSHFDQVAQLCRDMVKESQQLFASTTCFLSLDCTLYNYIKAQTYRNPVTQQETIVPAGPILHVAINICGPC